MVVGTANHGGYPLYRCPPTGDCTRRVTVSAELVEGVVTDAVREALADAEGRASAASSVRDAERALERAQADLDAPIRAFVGRRALVHQTLGGAGHRRAASDTGLGPLS
jgi:hypothetical protein